MHADHNRSNPTGAPASTSGLNQLPRRRYDAVVVGAGVAGLAFTIRRPPDWRVALLTKGALGESNTRYAQGGLAAAVGLDDNPALHEADTLAAGAGLCDPAAVRRLVEGGPAAVDWLLGLGTRFDRSAAGDLLLGREAAHSRWRVLHAGGDATGAEIERALVAGVRDDPNVDVFEGAFALDLIVADGRCAGIVAELGPAASLVALDASVTVVAAGGAGQLWAITSNPAGATADGLAMALRAGVAIADLEFAQFHPTVLALPDGPSFLVSEAVRGEGAYLRGAAGTRFLASGALAHPLAELAPRDVVARAIQRQMASDGTDHVTLDLRHLDPDVMRDRFPTIARELAARGLDLATDPIPVAPAAHYFMGGIIAGPTGETSLPGLLALGEAACTGVHGANRLASNSLLEGLVFGLAAADALHQERPEAGSPLGGGQGGEEDLPPTIGGMPGTFGQSGNVGGAHGPAPSAASAPATAPSAVHRPASIDPGRVPASEALADLRARLQRAMSRHVAVVRDAAGLTEAAREIDRVAAHLQAAEPANGREPGVPSPDTVRAAWELRNMTQAAAAIAAAALRREESRGAHFRADFPSTDPALDGRHLLRVGAGWRFGDLADVLAPSRHPSPRPA